jgi:hypothetical protein
MALLNEARVPYVAQNDAATGVGIRCGAAAIQAILYGRDDAFFHPATSADLKTGTPVRDDQDQIWSAIKNESRVVAPLIGGQAGVSEERQLCDPNAVPTCWATHPTVMGNLIERGVDITTGRLNGTAIAVQEVNERDVLTTARASLDRKVGAAILIERTHWVIVYRCETRGAHDFDIYFHDPVIEAETVWRGIAALNVAVLDAGIGSQAPGTQTVVVGATAAEHAHGGPLHGMHAAHRGGARAAPVPPGPPVFRAIAAEPLHTQITPSFRAMLAETARQDESLGQAFQTGGLTNVLPVRNGRKRFASYYLLEYGPNARLVVDASTRKPTLTARAVPERRQWLPPILDREALVDKIDGATVKIGTRSVTLDKRRFQFDEDLAWQLCDQSRSMLVPFYVVRQRRDDWPGDDRVYVRVDDGSVFPKLTRTLRGV